MFSLVVVFSKAPLLCAQLSAMRMTLQVALCTYHDWKEAGAAPCSASGPADASRTSSSSQAWTSVSSPPLSRTSSPSENASAVTGCGAESTGMSEGRQQIYVAGRAYARASPPWLLHRDPKPRRTNFEVSRARLKAVSQSVRASDLVVRGPRAQQAAAGGLPQVHVPAGAASRHMAAVRAGGESNNGLRGEAAL